jgi:putative FmdB family regulatory protein
MPFYDYKCKSCKHKFETLQSINEPPLEICPNCNEKSLQKLISIPFKGQLDIKNARELYETKIKPEAKAIAQKIRDGDEATAADIFGEDKLFN